MKRRILIALSLAISTSALGQDEGNIEVSAVDSGWNPKVQEYEVVEGDTLWGISANILGDPFLWPRVWAYNPEITNPHWIYPGDRVRFHEPEIELPSQADLIGGTMGMPEEEGESNTIEHAEGQSASELPTVEVVDSSNIPTLSTPSLHYVRRFITPVELEEAGRLTNAVPDTLMLAEGARIYMTFAKQRPKPGDSVLIYETSGEVDHPKTGARSGYVTQITGVAKVVQGDGSTGELTEAIITETIAEIERGQRVTPMNGPLRVPLVNVPANKEIEATVLAVRDYGNLISGDLDVIFIDKGRSAGLERGNRLRVLERGDGVTGRRQAEVHPTVGLVQVIDTRETTATCLVLSASRELEAGAEAHTIVGGAGG